MYYYFIKINYLFYKVSPLHTYMSSRGIKSEQRNYVYTYGSKI